MKDKLNGIFSSHFPSWSVPLALLGLCILSYSLLIKHLGYYWDDWPFIYISQKLGSTGLLRYFHTNRPIWGLIFQVTTPLLGHQPWRWHLFALLWRWLASLALWGVLRLVWPRHPQAALWSSLLFAVYPGSQEQFIALVFSHFFIVLTAFFASLGCSLAALRKPRLYLPLTLAGVCLALFNLLSMEYFFLLELLRPALLWLAIAGDNKNRRQWLLLTARHSLPYLLAFAGVTVWRVFFFGFQTTNYQPGLLSDLSRQPMQTAFTLGRTIILDMWTTSLGAWGKIFQFPDAAQLGRLTSMGYGFIVAFTAAAFFIYLLLSARNRPENHDSYPSLPLILLGLWGLFLAGWAYWLVKLPVSLAFPNSRVAMSFMPGASLLLAGLLGALPLPRWSRLTALCLVIGLAAGLHFQTANTFRRDWDVQNTLFWQMTWRIPRLQPGSALLINNLPLHYSTDNSLTAAVNWIYAPDNHTPRMDYFMYYPFMRLGTSLPRLEVEQTFTHDYLAATFYGSTRQVLAVVFNPPACLRVLDPELDSMNGMISEEMRYSASYSQPGLIQVADDPSPAALQADIFGPEIPHAWCYYFEKADLARQQGDWRQVASLGDQAFALDDYPNDPSERIPFIEGYAHTGEWQRSLDLTRASFQVTEMMQPVLCQLWQRIELQTPDSFEKQASVEKIADEMGCAFAAE